MICPCEVATKSVIPALRALVSKELVSNGLKQDEIATLLGISQSAISKYSRQVRGRALEIENVVELKPIINEITLLLTDENASRVEILRKFCAACGLIRKKGLMCELCRRSDASLETEQCVFCMSLVP